MGKKKIAPIIIFLAIYVLFVAGFYGFKFRKVNFDPATFKAAYTPLKGIYFPLWGFMEPGKQ